MAQRICVTGASGQAGRAVVTDLRAHGYEVTATDVAVSRADREDGMLRADLTDYGQAVEALSQADAVVHLANIPAPGLSTPAVTFNANITMNFNVFQAAAALKLNRVVWASSETTLGLPFDVPPRYAPVDEEHYPVPTSTYALSKVASETIAGHRLMPRPAAMCSRHSSIVLATAPMTCSRRCSPRWRPGTRSRRRPCWPKPSAGPRPRRAARGTTSPKRSGPAGVPAGPGGPDHHRDHPAAFHRPVTS